MMQEQITAPPIDTPSYAPEAPPWIRIIIKRAKTSGPPIEQPWHYLDYAKDASGDRVPVVCGTSIDTKHNQHKSIELSVVDPPDAQAVCVRCIDFMRQPYAEMMSKEMTYWRAELDGRPWLLMRQHDIIWYAFPIEGWSDERLARADPREIVSEASERGIKILSGEEAREPDFARYRFYGVRVDG
jgi:hypothetical protein